MKNNVVVLLSSYNGEKYIKEQIDSILNQKTEYEVDILIRDDGSTDSTRTILDDYVKRYPERVKTMYGENCGYIKSFFELIKVADGYKYYCLSDQDDVWLEHKVDAAVKLLDKEDNNKPLLYGSSSFLVDIDLNKYGETQRNLRGVTFNNVVVQNILPGHSQMFNDKLCQLLKDDIDYSRIYVHDSWITKVASVYGKIIFDNNSYTLYRQHGSNEVGFGKGIIGWIRERIKRVNKSDNAKLSEEIYYFYEKHAKNMDIKDRKEIEAFIKSQRSIVTRLLYVIKTKMYRQRTFETLLFKLLYLSGGYKSLR